MKRFRTGISSSFLSFSQWHRHRCLRCPIGHSEDRDVTHRSTSETRDSWSKLSSPVFFLAEVAMVMLTSVWMRELMIVHGIGGKVLVGTVVVVVVVAVVVIVVVVVERMTWEMAIEI